MIEKNISSPACEIQTSSEEKVSDFDLWLIKKDFVVKIKKEMLQQVLGDYQQLRDL